ncbi:putative E3 ubiquitin-protein ligase [Coemansia sp. BCRC 34301]|nr:putative E3 ubiquitin-protein ligase [Coemansia sp. BCRC 34301]
MVVSQFFAPLRTLKNKARGRAQPAASGWSDSDDDIARDDNENDRAKASSSPQVAETGKEPGTMTTGICLCCGSKVSFPECVACFKCTVCDTINDLHPLVRTDRVVENGQTVARARTPPPPLTLDRLKAGVQAFRKHPEKQALLEAMLRESFGSWDVLNFSFPSSGDAQASAENLGIAMAEVHAAYKIILALPPQVIRAMMNGIEQILRRPGRPLKQRSDIRYLLIIIENPLLLQQSFPQESSYHHHIVKSIVGSIANLPNCIHYILVLWLSQQSRSSVRRKVQLASQFISYRVQKYDRAKRRNPRVVVPLTSYSSQSNQTELPAFQRTRSSTNVPPGAAVPGSRPTDFSRRHMRMRSNTDSRISLSSHEKSSIDRIDESRAAPPIPPPPPPLSTSVERTQSPPVAETKHRTGLGIANLSLGGGSKRDRVPTAPSHLHLRGTHVVHDTDDAPSAGRGHRSRTLGAWAAAHGAALAAHSLTPPPPAHARDSPKLATSQSHSISTPRDVEAAGALPPPPPLPPPPLPSSGSVLGVLDGTAEPSSPATSIRGRCSLTRTRSSSEAPPRRRHMQREPPTASESRSPQPMGGISVDDYYVGADGVFYPKISSLVMHQHDWRLVAAAKFMALLHAANLLLPVRTRLPVDEFYIDAIDNMDLIGDYDAWQARIPGAFSFCQYPFLLTLRSKVQIMQVDAARQMDSKLKEAVISALFQNFTNGQQENQPHLKLLIRRRCLVEDSLHQLATHEQDLKKRLKIEFVGEEGVDGGGLAKEWFMLLVRELMNPVYGMFVRESTEEEESGGLWSGAYWFNPASLESSNQYFLVGVVVGLALYNSTILDLHLPLAVFKKLLPTGLYQAATAPGVASALFVAKSAAAEASIISANHYPFNSGGGTASSGGGSSDGRSPIYGLLSPSAQLRYQINEMLGDVSQFRPDLARGLRALLQYRDDDVEDIFCLTFEASYDAYGEVVTVPLVPNGSSVSVTSQNRVEYVMRYLQWVLNDSIAKQFEPFKRGFYYVCGGNALSLFKPEEIELMVRGSGEDWDPKDLMAVTELVNFEQGCEVLSWFWEVLQEMAPADRRLFLAFVTGSDRLPTVAANSRLRLKLVMLGSDFTLMKTYEVQDTLCYKTDPIFNVTLNQVAVSGHPTSFFYNDDCTYLVGMAYIGTPAWQNIYRPIRSFSVLGTY